LPAGGLAVDVAQDLGDALNRPGREDTDAASQGFGLDPSGADGILNAVDGFV
jgi:hypothetical protein